MPAALDFVSGGWHLRRANNNVYRPAKSCYYYYYPPNLENISHITLFDILLPFIYPDTPQHGII